MVWRRLQPAEPFNCLPAVAAELQRAARLQALQAALHEKSIEQCFALLRSVGVEPLLLKGWAVARLYPERHLRPSGDLDLLVRPTAQSTAAAALSSPSRPPLVLIDTHHEEFDALDEEEWDQLFARSQLHQLNQTPVRVLGAEDQLRFLCEHLLRHSVYRPLWLCDLAVMLEALPPRFDWERCLKGTRPQAIRLACAINLAGRLLGASLASVPEQVRATPLPAWLVSEVLIQWERPCTTERHAPELMAISLRHPRRWPRALLKRWPDPILASVRRGRSFDERARLPAQMAQYLAQSINFLRRLARSR